MYVYNVCIYIYIYNGRLASLRSVFAPVGGEQPPRGLTSIITYMGLSSTTPAASTPSAGAKSKKNDDCAHFAQSAQSARF